MSPADGGRAAGPTTAALRERLLRGVSTREEVASLREELGLAEDAQELEVARRLVVSVGGAEISRVAVAQGRRVDPRPVPGTQVVQGADSSFLGRLGAADDRRGKLQVSQLDDPRTVMAVARGGTLQQRRAAIRRLGRLVSDDKRHMSGELRRAAAELLTTLRDVDVSYELSEARSRLSGAAGRAARADRDQSERLASHIARRISAYWDGDAVGEPVTGLPGDQRAALLARARDLPGTLIDHLGALIESSGVVDRDERLSLIASLRFSGDPRLVAPFGAVLQGSDPELALEAARALGRIDDPRVHPVLLAAYERNVVASQRAVLAGALGHTGDARGAEFVRQSLESDEQETVRCAIEALQTVGGAEDSDAVARRLSSTGGPIALQAIRTLGRIGDGRALPELAQLREQTGVAAPRAELDAAVAAILARMELRGEEQDTGALVIRGGEDDVALARATSTGIRFLAWKDFMIGRLWLMLGAVRRAVARFERAAATRADWCRPLVAIAMVHARAGRYAQALASFRRAVAVDRPRIERTPAAVETMSRAFLRRADEVQRDGRYDIARGLLAEALSLDLRRAPSALRYEMGRRYEALEKRVS